MMKAKAALTALGLLVFGQSAVSAFDIKDPTQIGFDFEVDKTCHTTYGIQVIAEEINKGAKLKDFVAQKAAILKGQSLAKLDDEQSLCPKREYTPPISLEELAGILGNDQASDEICGTHEYNTALKLNKNAGQIYAGFFSDYAAEVAEGRNTATTAAKLDGETKYCRFERQLERERAQAAEVYRAVGLVAKDVQ
jgi:hypothetical protein